MRVIFNFISFILPDISYIFCTFFLNTEYEDSEKSF